MKILIQANTAEISQAELKSKLSPAQLNKATGQAIVAYTIAEEGESHPMVIGEGSQKLHWSRAVIQAVKEAVKSGTKLFNRHNADNSTKNRESVGEVITTYTKEISGKLRTIAVACMSVAESALYDICSIEAEIMEQGGFVSAVENVTGIAVSNSKVDNPAFLNAKRMQIVQCFTQDEPGKAGEAKNMLTLEEIMQAPIGMIQQAVSARQIHPSQLFGLKDYENDNELKEVFSERASLQGKVKNLETEIITQKDLLSKAQRDSSLITAKDLLKERMPKGLTDNQIKYITKEFKPEAIETLNETSVDEYIKKSQENYTELAKMFGGEKAADNNNGSADFETDNKSADAIDDIEKAFLED